MFDFPVACTSIHSLLQPSPHITTPHYTTLHYTTLTFDTTAMSSPKKTRTPQSATQENLLGLTANEARLLLLGVMYMDDAGKVSFTKLYLSFCFSSLSHRSSNILPLDRL